MSVSFAHPFRPFLVVLAALALALAACSTDDGSSQAPASQAAASEEAPASEAPASAATESEAPASGDASGDATVLVADSDLGEILTDAEGMTIYYFANDTEGTSNCTGDCLENWPPVVVDGEPTAGDGVEAELGTIDVEGETWLTVNGFPAYYFAGDAAAGDVNGQAVGDVWWVFGPDGEPIEE
jgi:predicted lipoprotein with Yx(FWY)xxD motif